MPTMLIQGARILTGEMEVAIPELKQQAVFFGVQGSAANEHKAHEFLCGCYFMLDMPKLAMGQLDVVADLPAYPFFARKWQVTSFWASQLGYVDALHSAGNRTAEIASRWPSALTQAVAKHSEALIAIHRRDFDGGEQLLLESLGLSYTAWSAFDLASLYQSASRLNLAAEYWRKFETRRGIVLRYWFTGAVHLAWLNQAIAARMRGDREIADQYARKIHQSWCKRNPETRIARVVGTLLL